MFTLLVILNRILTDNTENCAFGLELYMPYCTMTADTVVHVLYSLVQEMSNKPFFGGPLPSVNQIYDLRVYNVLIIRGERLIADGVIQTRVRISFDTSQVKQWVESTVLDILERTMSVSSSYYLAS